MGVRFLDHPVHVGSVCMFITVIDCVKTANYCFTFFIRPTALIFSLQKSAVHVQVVRILFAVFTCADTASRPVRRANDD